MARRQPWPMMNSQRRQTTRLLSTLHSSRPSLTFAVRSAPDLQMFNTNVTSFSFHNFHKKQKKIAFGMLVPTKLLGPCFAKSLNTPTCCPVRVNKTIQGCHPRPPCSMAPNMHHVPCFTETWPRAPDCPLAFRYWIHYCSNSINWRHDPSQQKANEKIATYIVIKMQLIWQEHISTVLATVYKARNGHQHGSHDAMHRRNNTCLTRSQHSGTMHPCTIFFV